MMLKINFFFCLGLTRPISEFIFCLSSFVCKNAWYDLEPFRRGHFKSAEDVDLWLKEDMMSVVEKQSRWFPNQQIVVVPDYKERKRHRGGCHLMNMDHSFGKRYGGAESKEMCANIPTLVHRAMSKAENKISADIPLPSKLREVLETKMAKAEFKIFPEHGSVYYHIVNLLKIDIFATMMEKIINGWHSEMGYIDILQKDSLLQILENLRN
jgi:hypothetical protein